MTWVRFDDSTTDHPKFAGLDELAPLAGWLWFSATCYCGRYLTDGRIDLVTLRRLWPYQPGADELINRLVAVRLFDQSSASTYRVHDYLKYNPSRREVMEARKNKKKAGQAGGTAAALARARRLLLEGKYPPSPSPKRRKAVQEPPANAPTMPSQDQEGSHAALSQPEARAFAAELTRSLGAKLGPPSHRPT